jgi:MarR family transcriptional regulator, negative regulator of the multidrug operon emrRAB
MQMNSQLSQFELMEANLDGLRLRMPDVPATAVLMCRLLVMIGREMSVMFEQQIKPFGFAEAEFRVLTTLFSQPNGVAHPSDLCVRASQSPANMSRISDALVSRGLITRVLSVHDRRKMVLRITEEGEELVRQLLPKLWVPLRALLADFPESDQSQLVDLLKRLGMEMEQLNALGVAERTG